MWCNDGIVRMAYHLALGADSDNCVDIIKYACLHLILQQLMRNVWNDHCHGQQWFLSLHRELYYEVDFVRPDLSKTKFAFRIQNRIKSYPTTCSQNALQLLKPFGLCLDFLALWLCPMNSCKASLYGNLSLCLYYRSELKTLHLSLSKTVVECSCHYTYIVINLQGTF